jgi:hypothetical protein
VDGLRHDGRRPPADGDGWRRLPLTDAPADPFFRAERVTVRGGARPWADVAWLVGVVTGGHGWVSAGGAALDLARGDTFAIPAAVLPDAALESATGLELIACRPPDPQALDRWVP